MLTTMMYQFNELTLPAHLKAAGKKNVVPIDRQEEWRHSVATAIATREIILKRHLEAWEHVGYLAGLMHDIGRVFFCHYMPDEYRLVLSKHKTDDVFLAQHEEDIIGADHGQVGAWIVDRWNLPKEIVEPIAYHHFPQKAKDGKELTTILHVGDMLARKIRNPEESARAWAADAAWREAISLNDVYIQEIEALVLKELRQIETFMAVG
jgi:putative nucleotidyltransferase with HDIG domain